jgi:regulatory protein YycI of two-component signal transduction system YycFG
MNERVSSLPTRYYFWTGFIIIVIIIYILLMTIYVKPVTIDTNDVIDANKIKNENENEITIITTREEQSPKEKEKMPAVKHRGNNVKKPSMNVFHNPLSILLRNDGFIFFIELL